MSDTNYRGMLKASLGDDGGLLIEHQETHKTFQFKLQDLDEVVGVLIDFRNEIQAGRVGGFAQCSQTPRQTN